MEINLMTTTSCNFACSYCFENGINRHLYLTNTVIVAIILGFTDYNDSSSSQNILDEKAFVELLPVIYNKIGNYGYYVPEYYNFTSFCMVSDLHTIVVYPNGDLNKCLCMVGKEDCIVGNVYKYETFKDFFLPNLYYKCIKKACPFLPICHTGCRNRALNKSGDVYSVDCRKHLLELINKKFIQLKLNKNH
jgi:radical SAM protein with 4Fe4S-binding SPASM domain